MQLAEVATQESLNLGRNAPRQVYLRIRDFLAGRLLGATRDEALVDEVIKCVFCRVLAARTGETVPDDPIALARFYRSRFAHLKDRLPGVFEPDSEILLDPSSLHYVDQHLKTIDALDPLADPIGDCYEAFMGSAIRGAEGQFFTPQSAVRLLVDLVDPQRGERIMDPACGAGGFLSHTAKRLAQQGVSPPEISRSIVGIDKDEYLARLARAHVGLVTLSGNRVYCGDSLAWTPVSDGPMLEAGEIGTFDVILTNPPFGAKIVAASPEVQREFELGYSWKQGRDGTWHRTTSLQRRVPPQVLFVERLISLVRPGGRIGVVLPESLISGKSYRYVVQYIREATHVRAVVGMPEDLFKTSGKGGTHTKVCLLLLEKKDGDGAPTGPQSVFMAEAKWCGNDSRGRSIDRDELPEIARRYRDHVDGKPHDHSRLGYQLAPDSITDNILAPRYYDPDVDVVLEKLSATHSLVTVRELIDDDLLEITTGHEVGKLAYGGGTVPFVRTSDISNWEIKRDPKHCVSEEEFARLAPKQDVRAGDILLVRDGTYLIGTCAIITEYDTRIVFQSHIYKLRVKDPDKLSPYLLLAMLSSEPVQQQIRSKRFTQDIIDSLGERITEIVLPIPKSEALRKRIDETVERSILERVASRELARQACLDVVSVDSPEDDQ